MDKKEFLKKYDNKKPYGWVVYSVTCCPPCFYYSVFSVGKTKDEAEENAKKKYGEDILSAGERCSCNMKVESCQTTEAAYRKLKTAKTFNSFHNIECDGITIKAYNEV